jgi:hypothetical protein
MSGGFKALGDLDLCAEGTQWTETFEERFGVSALNHYPEEQVLQLGVD